ncbi:hypothetical protein KIPB_010137, partial [Kipferlia bialata]
PNRVPSSIRPFITSPQALVRTLFDALRFQGTNHEARRIMEDQQRNREATRLNAAEQDLAEARTEIASLQREMGRLRDDLAQARSAQTHSSAMIRSRVVSDRSASRDTLSSRTTHRAPSVAPGFTFNPSSLTRSPTQPRVSREPSVSRGNTYREQGLARVSKGAHRAPARRLPTVSKFVVPTPRLGTPMVKRQQKRLSIMPQHSRAGDRDADARRSVDRSVSHTKSRFDLL